METGIKYQANLDQANLERMCFDIQRTAEIAGVPYNRYITRGVLEAYKDFFSGSPVTFVTNTRPLEKRNLSVRYVELQAGHDPFQIALEKGLINTGFHPLCELLGEIRSRFPMKGYGVDLDVSLGVTKIWSFLVPQPVRNTTQILSLPHSVRDYIPYYYRHDLDTLHYFALDFRDKTVELHFMVKEPGRLTTGQVRDMLTGLDFEVPPPALLEYCTQATTIYPTFSWNSEDITRLCFGVNAHGAHQVPTHLDPLLDLYTRQAPILSEQRNFIYGMTFERRGHYIKIENDYTGNMIDLMERRVRS